MKVSMNAVIKSRSLLLRLYLQNVDKTASFLERECKDLNKAVCFQGYPLVIK